MCIWPSFQFRMVRNFRGEGNNLRGKGSLARLALGHAYKKLGGPKIKMTQVLEIVSILQAIHWSYGVVAITGAGAINRILQRLRNLNSQTLEYEEAARSYARHFERGREPLLLWEIWSDLIAKCQLAKTIDNDWIRGPSAAITTKWRGRRPFWPTYLKNKYCPLTNHRITPGR